MPHVQPKGVVTIGKLSTIFLNARLRFLVAFFPLLGIVGCHYAEGVATTLQQEDNSVFSRLAVVPFQQIAPDDDGSRIAHCPICGAVFTANTFPLETEKILDNILLERLKRSGNFRLLDPENVAGVYRRLSSGAAKTELPKILRNLGHELGAEGVVVGYVYRFREREGYPYSVKQPASVAFEIHLLRGRDGTQVWRGIFDKTQRSLTENILQLSSFYRQKGRWATAEELAEEGMDEILKEFPGFKERQKD
jgi:hypothetical protein